MMEELAHGERSHSALTKKVLTQRNTRPITPHINLYSANDEEEIHIRNIKKGNEPENLIKNFSAFMKQIIETKNENFLSGDMKVIEYIISKYLKIEIEEIKNLEKLSIKINTDFGLLNQFGEYLTNLKELRLNYSVIPSISDVGTSFKNLKVLHIANCSLKDLSEVLEASDNEISDLFELEMCSTLKRLNLKNNLISDEENIQFLSNMTVLKWLNLNGNPIKQNKNYEDFIKETLPSVESLDVDEEYTNDNSDINNKFLQSHSTFSSSPSFSNNVSSSAVINRPMTSTGTNFFNNNKVSKITENLENEMYNNEMAQTMRNFSLNDKTNSPDVKSQNNIQGLRAILKTKGRANKFGDTFTNFQMCDKISFSNENEADSKKNKPWNSPDRPKFDFSLRNNEVLRGKSQIQSNNDKALNEESNTINFQKPTTLRPVIVKKETPFEMRSFKKSVDEDLTSDIMKQLDKNKFPNKEGGGKAFKISHFNKDIQPSGNNLNLNILKNSLLQSKDGKQMPMKLKLNKTKSPNVISKEEKINSTQTLR